MYRDAANYKQYSEEVFSNYRQLSLENIDLIIRSKLIEDNWFYAERWHLRDLHFYYCSAEFDHEYHEYWAVEETNKAATKGDVSEFLKLISPI